MGGLRAIIIVAVAFVLAYAIKVFFEKKLKKSIKEQLNRFRMIIYALMALVISTGIYFASEALSVPVETILVIKVLVMFVALYLLFLLTDYFTDHLVHVWYQGQIRSKLKLITFFNLLIKLLTTVFVVFVLFRFWSIDLVEVSTYVFYLIQGNSATLALSVFLIYLIIAKIVLFIFKTYFTEVVKKTKTKIDDILVSRLEYPISWFIVLLGIIISLKTVETGVTYVIPIVKSIIVALVAHTLLKLADDLLEEWWIESPQQGLDEDIIQITSNFLKIIIIVISLIVMLIVWGADIKSLLLSVGIISVVLGFALKGSLDNIFSGISLMLDHTFRVGDVIKLESSEIGEVIHIGLRSTKVKTYDNELLVIPNSILANMRVINYARPDNNLRIIIPVGVAYGSDVEKVKKVLRNALKNRKEISLPHLSDVWFVKMNDFSLDFKVIFYIDDYRKKYKTESIITTMIYDILKKNKLNIPFPTRTLYMNKGKNGRETSEPQRRVKKTSSSKKKVSKGSKKKVSKKVKKK
ncbi:mechanosensitive ion channel [Candidatus Woesearchaeota archaeon]|jgi:small-conductance mechanosensitive channel|nr:mechanosensitive ion channel [Candidatus Woesearchaeota archaeon]MBT5272143.1 mechanosensitive ion channel [Candidatus Woesearchaeota archaeon]MBT6040946.1 mechanosensitive ion channel [Candidatus Woesearchaeota archaeon]MBT6336280.1 mechanosensitive ion channel [Candidatus Woesearchaeota archaeon]MBT7927263.1 mechanosensitive ion channel [Candidatus Woesearchaeota archaeon]